jgi:hypothetical protein
MLMATDPIAVTVFSYDVDRESIKREMVDFGSEYQKGLGPNEGPFKTRFL